jgi:hypothetical protein
MKIIKITEVKNDSEVENDDFFTLYSSSDGSIEIDVSEYSENSMTAVVLIINGTTYIGDVSLYPPFLLTRNSDEKIPLNSPIVLKDIVEALSHKSNPDDFDFLRRSEGYKEAQQKWDSYIRDFYVEKSSSLDHSVDDSSILNRIYSILSE